MTEDVSRIQWRGRSQQRRTLEFYLQDVAGQLLMADLTETESAPADHRACVLRLSSAARTLRLLK